MTEMNSATLDTTFEQLIAKQTRTLNPNASDTLKRENMRTFTVADNYQTLSQMRQAECDTVPVGPNYQYPIVGTIGIDEMIRTFLTMALHEDLNGTLDAKQPPNDPSKSVAGPPSMVDTITFTTTHTGGRRYTGDNADADWHILTVDERLARRFALARGYASSNSRLRPPCRSSARWHEEDGLCGLFSAFVRPGPHAFVDRCGCSNIQPIFG
jgi:hypothetical protein